MWRQSKHSKFKNILILLVHYKLLRCSLIIVSLRVNNHYDAHISVLKVITPFLIIQDRDKILVFPKYMSLTV